MPAGVGYGPLPPPPGLLTDQPVGIPRPVLPGAEQQIPPPSLGAVEMLQPPQIQAEAAPEQIPPPPAVAEEQPAPVPTWLQDTLAARQPSADATSPEAAALGAEAAAVAGAPEIEAEEPDEFVLPEGIAPDSPTGLMLRGAWVQQQAQQAKVEQLELAGSALKEAEQRTATRLEEQQARQEQARERVTAQNAEIQQALRQGPGSTWRDVVFAGASALGAVLGAAFDRSGTLQKQLPQTLNAIVGQWQERTQSAFGRELQALQVGREGAQDELDEALDESRQIEQAGAAARVAILEEAQRQIQLAGEQGQLDLMELQRLGIPQQMEAEIEAARAKQAQIAEEKQRQMAEDERKARAAEADIRLTEERIRGERADRAQQRADLALDRERLDLQRQAQATETVKDQIELHDKQLGVALKQKEIEAKDLNRTLLMPDGSPIKLNSTAEGAQKQGVAKVATARKLGRLVDEIVQAAERTGYDPKWLGSPEGQKTRLLWRKLWLSVKDQEELGAITGPDEKILDDVTGADPTSFSPDALRGTAERLKLLKRTTEDEVDDYLSTASSDYVQRGERFELPVLDAPGEAVPTAEEARGQLLPIQSAVTGKRPPLEPKEHSAAVKTLRETIATEVGRTDADAVLRRQAAELGDSLKQARDEKERLERERLTAQTNRRRFGDTRSSPQARQWGDKEAELLEERKTVEAYEKRLAESLKRERKLLWDRIRGGDPRARVSPEDRAAYRGVAALIGDLGGKKPE